MIAKKFEISRELFNYLNAMHGAGLELRIIEVSANHSTDPEERPVVCNITIDAASVSIFDPRRFPQLIIPTYAKVSSDTFWELDEEFEARELYHKPHGARDYLLVSNYQTLAQAFENDCLYRKGK